AFLVGLAGLYPVGYFLNGFLLNSGGFIMLLILVAFLAAIPAALAHDVQNGVSVPSRSAA
ncbi:MAG TPA: hypothetical protein VD902_18690, partial [Symbiobacteriaceae bacterium]|nr:hypothetical protein [Symbiobacteriaceae bacterium]